MSKVDGGWTWVWQMLGIGLLGGLVPAIPLAATLGERVDVLEWVAKPDSTDGTHTIESRYKIDDSGRIDVTLVLACKPSTQLTDQRTYKANTEYFLVLKVTGAQLQTEVDTSIDLKEGVNKIGRALVEALGSQRQVEPQKRFVRLDEWFDAGDHNVRAVRVVDDYKFTVQRSGADFGKRSLWNMQFPIMGREQQVTISLKASGMKNFLSRCEAAAGMMMESAERTRKRDGTAAVEQGNLALRQQQDYRAAQQAYLKAEELGFGNADVDVTLGWTFLYGAGGATQNAWEAWKWFELAANQGSAIAQYYLGLMSEKGWSYAFGIPNNAKAEEWYLRSASQEYTAAQSALARLYLRRGNQYDAKALEYGKRAAAKGSPGGQFVVGLMHAYGRGGDAQDCPDGLEKLTAAANSDIAEPQDIAVAQYALGMLHDGGICVPAKDQDQARQWMTRAASAGNSGAADWLNRHETKPVARSN